MPAADRSRRYRPEPLAEHAARIRFRPSLNPSMNPSLPKASTSEPTPWLADDDLRGIVPSSSVCVCAMLRAMIAMLVGFGWRNFCQVPSKQHDKTLHASHPHSNPRHPSSKPHHRASAYLQGGPQRAKSAESRKSSPAVSIACEQKTVGTTELQNINPRRAVLPPFRRPYIRPHDTSANAHIRSSDPINPPALAGGHAARVLSGSCPTPSRCSRRSSTAPPVIGTRLTRTKISSRRRAIQPRKKQTHLNRHSRVSALRASRECRLPPRGEQRRIPSAPSTRMLGTSPSMTLVVVLQTGNGPSAAFPAAGAGRRNGEGAISSGGPNRVTDCRACARGLQNSARSPVHPHALLSPPLIPTKVGIQGQNAQLVPPCGFDPTRAAHPFPDSDASSRALSKDARSDDRGHAAQNQPHLSLRPNSNRTKPGPRRRHRTVTRETLRRANRHSAPSSVNCLARYILRQQSKRRAVNRSLLLSPLPSRFPGARRSASACAPPEPVTPAPPSPARHPRTARHHQPRSHLRRQQAR